MSADLALLRHRTKHNTQLPARPSPVGSGPGWMILVEVSEAPMAQCSLAPGPIAIYPMTKGMEYGRIMPFIPIP